MPGKCACCCGGTDCKEEMMINDRNLMSHTYNFNDFNKVLKALQSTYYAHFEELYIDFMEQNLNE